jgi:GT2 family glycosyltransferase/glycosyltransferase involved in cell wall biosynthesis
LHCYLRKPLRTSQKAISALLAVNQSDEYKTPRDEGPLDVLVIHEMLPHPDRHGADLQWMQMLQVLRSQGHRVTHVARSGVNRARYAPPLEDLGIRVFAPDAERLRFLGFDFLVEWTFEQLLAENKFDLAILFHWFWNGISIPEHYLEDIRRLSPATFIAVLTDDQQGRREMQLAELTHYWADYERSADFASREMEVYRRADVVLTISEDDRRAFLQAAPDLRTGSMPMIATSGPPGLPFHSRADVLFLANFDNPANRDAADWMLGEIWPRIRKHLPQANLALVGNNLPAALGNKQPGIRRVGYVEDLSSIFGACRVAVSPVRFGTGIKTKNLLALAHGLPLVTTTVGADGMNLSSGVSALVADSVEDFSGAVVRAYQNEDLWLQLSSAGRARITSQFSKKAMEEAVSAVVDQARTLRPKPYEPDFEWSYRIVESRFPEVVTGAPAANRSDLRIAKYLELAEDPIHSQQPARALQQLRHIVGMLRSPVAANGLHLEAFRLMASCYSTLGEAEKAAQYQCRAAQLMWIPGVSSKSSAKKNAKHCAPKSAAPHFSVVIPTYNRESTLRACLTAIEQQTLRPDEFEVIVVDDGSTDGTEVFCRGYSAPFAFSYLRQLNAGAGAARRRGVQRARGDFLLLMNDDSIASPGLFAVHRDVHAKLSNPRQAVLGDFRFPPAAADRALARFLASSPFLFPQATLQPGKHWQYTHFVTCNLSVSRQAVLDAGSFDPQFRVAEDSELGLRLSRKGFGVYYAPHAHATHDHLPFTIEDLIRRARIYGNTQLSLLRKHPGLLGDGQTLFGMLDEAAVGVWRNVIGNREREIETVVKQLERIDSVPFAPFLAMTSGERSAAEEITALFGRCVPDVYWYYFFSSLLEAWNREPQHVSANDLQLAIKQNQVYI